MENEQLKFWSGEFGTEYTDRNNLDVNSLYLEKYGVSREEMNTDFLSFLDRKSKILEIGCNRGKQLELLKSQGFSDLWAVEINEHAYSIANRSFPNKCFLASVYNLPFEDNFFDLTFTSGVLIHISPDDLTQAMNEIYRTSKKYIWGFEYHSEKSTSIPYRGYKNVLWKTDFCKLFLQNFPQLKLIKQKHYKYLNDQNVDVMYLLEKSA